MTASTPATRPVPGGPDEIARFLLSCQSLPDLTEEDARRMAACMDVRSYNREHVFDASDGGFAQEEPLRALWSGAVTRTTQAALDSGRTLLWPGDTFGLGAVHRWSLAEERCRLDPPGSVDAVAATLAPTVCLELPHDRFAVAFGRDRGQGALKVLLAAAHRSKSTMRGRLRLLDGGYAADVPCQILADESTDLIIAVNPFPMPAPRPQARPWIPVLTSTWLSLSPTLRWMDVMRGYQVLWRFSSGRQTVLADICCQLNQCPEFPVSFWAGRRIIEQTMQCAELRNAVAVAEEAWEHGDEGADLLGGDHPTRRVRRVVGRADVLPQLVCEDPAQGRRLRRAELQGVDAVTQGAELPGQVAHMGLQRGLAGGDRAELAEILVVDRVGEGQDAGALRREQAAVPQRTDPVDEAVGHRLEGLVDLFGVEDGRTLVWAIVWRTNEEADGRIGDAVDEDGDAAPAADGLHIGRGLVDALELASLRDAVVDAAALLPDPAFEGGGGVGVVAPVHAEDVEAGIRGEAPGDGGARSGGGTKDEGPGHAWES